MAQAHLLISEYGSLNFNNEWRQCEQQRREFTHRVVAGDPVTMQYGIPQGTSQTWTAVTVKQYNLKSGASVELMPMSAATIDDHTFYDISVDTSTTGCFRITIEVTSSGQTITVAEAFFEVVSELHGSVLFGYQNVKNKDNTVFTRRLYFRCPAKFFPQNEEYSSEDNDFRDQEYDPSLLSSEAYTTYGLTVGGPQGVPTWVGRKLNRILSCTEVYLGEMGSEVQFTKSNGAKIERASLGDMNPLYQFSVKLEKVIGTYSVLIGEYIPNVEEYNDIVIEIEFVEDVAEEAVFSISPSIANFEYNETAARTIYVTAADNTWAVAADDTSWLTVTKNSNGTVSITPTQNSGDANRTQQVTFTWTSTTGAVTTKTLYVTQYAQAIVTGQITISGKLVDSVTGAAIANFAQDNYNIYMRLYANGYNILFGNIATDSSGNFSITAETDEDSYATWGNLTFYYTPRYSEGTNTVDYQSKTMTITAPAFADAVAGGISFGDIALTPYPKSNIIVDLEFVESDPINNNQILIYGRVVNYSGTPIINATVAIKNDDALIATVTTDSSGNFSYIWTTTEDTWNNMNLLQFTITKNGQTDEDAKLAAYLPLYADAVGGGVDVGDIYFRYNN